MTRRCRELTAEGIDVINLSIGEPDFNTPEHIKAAAIKPFMKTAPIIPLSPVTWN